MLLEGVQQTQPCLRGKQAHGMLTEHQGAREVSQRSASQRCCCSRSWPSRILLGVQLWPVLQPPGVS